MPGWFGNGKNVLNPSANRIESLSGICWLGKGFRTSIHSRCGWCWDRRSPQKTSVWPCRVYRRRWPVYVFTMAGLKAQQLVPRRKKSNRSVAKLPSLIGRRWHRLNAVGSGPVLAELLEIEKEESPVLAVVHLGNVDRPAHRESIIVAAQCVADVLALFAGSCVPSSVNGKPAFRNFVDEIVVGRCRGTNWCPTSWCS